jgi:hypothetical protein
MYDESIYWYVITSSPCYLVTLLPINSFYKNTKFAILYIKQWFDQELL